MVILRGKKRLSCVLCGAEDGGAVGLPAKTWYVRCRASAAPGTTNSTTSTANAATAILRMGSPPESGSSDPPTSAHAATGPAASAAGPRTRVPLLHDDVARHR